MQKHDAAWWRFWSVSFPEWTEQVKSFAPPSAIYALMQTCMMSYPASSLRLVAVAPARVHGSPTLFALAPVRVDSSLTPVAVAQARVLDSPSLLVVVATGLLDRSSF